MSAGADPGAAPAPSPAAPTLTIAVLTHNEAQRIGDCLRSAAFADQLLVVDSGSTDATTSIARALGAEVYSYPDWQGFAMQRNRQLAHARCDYVFFLDADELMSPAFAQELQALVRSGAQALWAIRWTLVAYGRELKYFRARSQIDRRVRGAGTGAGAARCDTARQRRARLCRRCGHQGNGGA